MTSCSVTAGRTHDLMLTNELLATLSAELLRQRDRIVEKEAQCERLLLKTSQEINEHDEGTRVLVQELCAARDKEVSQC